MPTSLLSADTMFPNFKGNETTEEKVNQIQNYLYMLVEQLRYSMANVGKENFNEAEFEGIVNLITEPVYLQMTSEDGAVASMIQATAKGLESRIQGVSDKVGSPAEGENAATGLYAAYSEITQTLNSITLTAEKEGNQSKITLSGTGISQTVSVFSKDFTDDIKSVSDKVGSPGEKGENGEEDKEATGLYGEISAVTSQLTKIEQNINGITLSSTGNGTTSKITLTYNGADITSTNITFTGEVTFQALQDRGYITTGTIDNALSGKGYVTTAALEDVYNTTTINGAYISTGIIEGVEYRAYGQGRCFVVKKENGKEIGGIQYKEILDDFEVDPYSEYADKLYLYTKQYDEYGIIKSPSIKLYSEGRISIEAPYGLVYIKGTEYITITDGIAQWTFRGGNLYKNNTPVL